MFKNKKIIIALITLLAFAALMVACTSQAPVTQEPAENAVQFTGQYIVDADYLKAAISKDNVVIIDARGPEAAAKGTIQGAIALVWQQMADVTSGKTGDAMWGTLLSADKLSKVLAANGIAYDKEILVFADAQAGWGSDGRILWGLIAAGYSNVKMVNGGYEYLVAYGLPTQKGASKPVAAEVKVEKIDETHIINTEGLTTAYDTFTVVDVRADEEYNGATLYGEAAGGHLQGAILVKYTDLFNEDTTLKSNEQLIALFTTAGLKPDQKIVSYCTAGIRSAYMQLILEMCGFENSMNYDESFYRWAATEPLE